MIEPEDKWPAMHTYRKAVARGHAEPIACPDCGSEMVPVVNKILEPALKCLSCSSTFTPGLRVWDQIEKVFRTINTEQEHY